MAENQYKNKVVYGGTTLIDLTEDTVDAAHLMSGYTAHDATGAPITGTATAGSPGTVFLVRTNDDYGNEIMNIFTLGDIDISTVKDANQDDVVTITSDRVIDITNTLFPTYKIDEDGYFIVLPETATIAAASGVSF